MLYGNVNSMNEMTVECPLDPIGYAIVHDKSRYEIDFFREHEGVQILTWDTGSTGTKDYSGFDRYLEEIREKSSFTYHIGKVTTGKRILVLEYHQQSAGSSIINDDDKTTRLSSGDFGLSQTTQTGSSRINSGPSGVASRENSGNASISSSNTISPRIRRSSSSSNNSAVAAAAAAAMRTSKSGLGMGDLKTFLNKAMNKYDKDGSTLREEFDITTSVEQALGKLEEVANGKIKPYDAIVTIFGESRDDKANFEWKKLVDGMRKLPHKAQTPFVVYSSDWNQENRRKFCMQYGAFDFTTTFPQLFNALDRLLDYKPAHTTPSHTQILPYTYNL